MNQDLIQSMLDKILNVIESYDKNYTQDTYIILHSKLDKVLNEHYNWPDYENYN